MPDQIPCACNQLSFNLIQAFSEKLRLSKSEIATAPLLPVTICFAAGIAVYFLNAGVWLAILLLTAAAITLFFNRYAAILILTVLIGLTDASVSIPLGPAPELTGRNLVIEGEITDFKVNESTLRLTLQIDKAGPDTNKLVKVRPHRVSLVSTNPGFDAEKGLRLTVNTILTPLTASRDLPDEIDFADFMARKQIYLSSFFTEKQVIRIQPPGFLRTALNASAERLTQCFSESSLSPFAKEFMISALAGDTTDLSDDSRDLFRNAGISHVLAISGLHVGIIAFVISIILWPLYIIGFGRTRSIIIIAAVWLYAMIIGLPASVVRAALMATIYLTGRLLQRRTSPLNSLALAALCILVVSPEALFQIGFQLSFAAVLAIILFAERLNPVDRRRRIAYNVASYLCVTLSAVIGTGILTIIYFHSFPTYFLIGNLLSALLLPFVIGGGVIMVALGFFGLHSESICMVLSWLCALIKLICESISSLPGSSYDGLYLREWIVIPTAISVIALKWALDAEKQKRKTVGLTAAAITLVMTVCCIMASDRQPTEPRIYVASNKHHTDMIIPMQNNVLKIVTTAPNEPLNVISRAEFRYRDFMQKRGIGTLSVDTTRRHNDRMIAVGNVSIGLISGKETLPEGKLSYALLCKGYRSGIELIDNRYSPDTILLASDLNPRTARRYMNECDELGIPFVNLREKKWSLSYPISLSPIVK